MYRDETPITDLNLPSTVLQILEAHDVKDYGTLCCVTLRQLKEWGIDPVTIGQILNQAKR